MNRGEVWWVEEPGAARRPGCVLTRQEALPVLGSITVTLATRTIRSIPTEVELGGADGMPETCVLSLDNLQAVPKALLTEKITTLSAARMREVCTALGRATGC